ncbi:extracellular solute-binding protein [Natronomonas sp. F2-12]|jgi:spermidine/putrescine transport system substrate-binding protein|uniref:Extracellular solute-binding protein n=1 Tax=Natronomonas aquatica TaxID=2841590 RepID=A0A9R1CQL4_9EURY|nr:extracellular solute-binding protein [Natronomonas aquatica]MCQ4332100.1 extracellular solute-binding protein [Natronomonas aquatica]
MTYLTRRDALKATAASVTVSMAGCLARGSGQDLSSVEEWPPDRNASEIELWTWQRYWGDQAMGFKHAEDLEGFDRIVVPSFEQERRLRDGEAPDVVHLFSRQFANAMEEGLLQPLPTDVMPVWPPEVPLRGQELSFYGQDGDFYGYPQAPVAMSLAYHFDVLSEATDWSLLWDEAHEGRVSMPADPVLLGQIGALYTGQDPFDPEDPDAVREALLEQEPIVDNYWTHWFDAWTKFEQGELDVGVLPHPRMCLCSQDYTPIRYGNPGGRIYAQSTLAVPADAANPYLAAEFLNWSANLKVGTETGWFADEWDLYSDRPVSGEARETYRSVAADLGIEEA